jgi:hypothetical protein
VWETKAMGFRPQYMKMNNNAVWKLKENIWKTKCTGDLCAPFRDFVLFDGISHNLTWKLCKLTTEPHIPPPPYLKTTIKISLILHQYFNNNN